jgi:hypothetical protein
MEVSGQIRTPAALLLGKPPYAHRRGLDELKRQCAHCGKEKIFLSLPGIET